MFSKSSGIFRATHITKKSFSKITKQEDLELFDTIIRQEVSFARIGDPIDVINMEMAYLYGSKNVYLSTALKCFNNLYLV